MTSFSAILVISTITLVASRSTTVVNTTSGPVQGQILTTLRKSIEYASFAGIRYAKPPLGYLRFKPPVPVEPWNEVLNATDAADDCPQMSLDNVFEGSEDCLFLNVVTPVINLESPPTKLKSVMVWIHGGAFKTGSSSTKGYSPDYLLEEDIVFVSISYRLGALGFLTLNHQNATGNAGLKDQNFALKWIQANIKNFGGNPNNVTLMGQSSGAAAVGFHTLSDASVGLFHGTISMSGTALNPWAFKTLTKSFTVAKQLGMLLGTTSNDKETLLTTFYAASAEALVRAAEIIGEITPLAPTLEDTSLGTDIFLSECSIKKYMTGNFTKVPQMLGFVQQETMIFLANPNSFTVTIDSALQAYPSPVLYGIRDLFGSFTNVDVKKNSSFFQILVNETSEILYTSPVDFTQSLLVDINDAQPVYYYHFTFNSNASFSHLMFGSEDNDGPTHNDDLAYVFSIPLVDDNLGPSGPVARNIHRVSTMWTNFAKYGNPTPHWIPDDSLPVIWPTSGRSGLVLDIGSELTVASRPVNLNMEIIKSALKESLLLRNGCTGI